MTSEQKINSDVERIAFGNRKTKKISINLDEETLDFIDEIAERTKTTRTWVILASLTGGLDPLLKNLETTWNGMLVSGNLDENKKKRINELIAVVQDLRRKLLGKNTLKPKK
jgi:hypothetical protein